MKVWVTRAAPGADATARRVALLGHEPLIAPLLIVRALPAPKRPVRADAIAFTSANAVRVFDSAGLHSLPVFAVGEATAQAAREAGYGSVRAGEADVAALGALIADRLPAGSVVLHPCAAERAGDLLSPLRAAGLTPLALPVYETVAASVDSDVTAAAAQAEAILLHSPKAARALLALDAPIKARVLCLSPAVARALDGGNFPDVASATLPNDDALLNLL